MHLTLDGVDDKERERRFGVVTRGLIEDLGRDRDFWVEIAPVEMCPDGHPGGLDVDTFRRRVQNKVGIDLWADLSLRSSLDLLKFAYQFASAPKSYWFHQFCGGNHPSMSEPFDTARARYDLTVEVNQRLSDFGIDLRMRGGAFQKVIPEELDPLFTPLEGGLDALAEGRVRNAIIAFKQDRERRDAVWRLVQAFERAKTLFDRDKQIGARAMAEALSPHPDLINEVETAIKALTDIGHNAFRHDEANRPIALDEADLEFWFMQFLVLLRAVDRALARARSTSGNSPDF
jgi:hypothetical protein